MNSYRQFFNLFSNFKSNGINFKKLISYFLILFLLFNSNGLALGFEIESDENQISETSLSISSMPTKRAGLGVVEVDGKIYCIGGNTGSAYSSAVEVYDINTGTWSTKTSMPTAREDLGVVAYGSKIYCIGGYNGSYLKTVEIYNTESNSWTTGASMTTARSNFGITESNGIIYCAGGYNGSYLSTLHAYDISNNTWSTQASTGYTMEGSSLVSNNDKLYLIGGYEYSSGCRFIRTEGAPSPCRAYGDEYYSVIREYDISKNSWTTKTSMSVYKSDFSAIVVGNKILCIGGKGSNGAVDTINIYDISTDSWSNSKTTLPSAMYDFGAVKYNNDIYYIGGTSNSGIVSELNTYFYAYDTGLTPQQVTSAVDVYIGSENMLALSLSTASITFEDFDGVSNMEKANAITMTVSSSLPYNINSYLVGNIISSSGNTMDKSILNIKTNGTTEYKTFVNNTTPIELVNNATQGNSKTHNIDLMLKGNIAHTADVYKATIKLEVVQG